MIVTVIILAIVGSMLGAWFVTGVRGTSLDVNRTTDLLATNVAAQRLVSDIQLAVPTPGSTTAGPFVSGSHDSISMYTMINNLTNPALVTWSVTGSGTYNATLVRTYVPPVVTNGVVTWPTTGSGVVKQNVLTGVNDTNNGKTPPIFRFLNATNAALNQLCTDVTPTPGSCTGYAVPLSSDPLSSTDVGERGRRDLPAGRLGRRRRRLHHASVLRDEQAHRSASGLALAGVTRCPTPSPTPRHDEAPMTKTTMLRLARRVHRVRAGAESGFAMIIVLGMATVMTLLIGGGLLYAAARRRCTARPTTPRARSPTTPRWPA